MFRRLFVYGKIFVDIINISSRAMMGEFIIYYRGTAFGGIYDDRLLVKSVPVAVKMMPDAEMEPPYAGAKKKIDGIYEGIAETGADGKHCGGIMEETKELITTDAIRSKVYILRGQQVMLDQDLAEIYGYQVKNLNQQVKRNLTRFPEDFMFQLTKEEVELVKSQFVTSRNINYFEGQEGGRRKLPYAFTEQGIYMLATVLRGELAEQQSIFIMRTFREMRHYISQNQQFVTRNEMELLTAKVGTITERQDRMEKKVDSIQKDVTILADNFITDKDKKNFVIYKGQKLEADIAYIEIYQQAKKSIYVVDDYMNAKSLQHLSQKADGVEVVLFTENGKGGRGFLTNSLVTDFQNEYPTIRIKPNPDCHDRLIILDYGEKTELVYHCGASSKDAGKKLCAINQITETAIIHPVIDRLLSLPDKQV